MAPVFFVSYARLDVDYPEYREELRQFVEQLEAKVAVSLAIPRGGVAFLDQNIRPGEIWSDQLRNCSCIAASG